MPGEHVDDVEDIARLKVLLSFLQIKFERRGNIECGSDLADVSSDKRYGIIQKYGYIIDNVTM